jgi:hypothetical protein
LKSLINTHMALPKCFMMPQGSLILFQHPRNPRPGRELSTSMAGASFVNPSMIVSARIDRPFASASEMKSNRHVGIRAPRTGGYYFRDHRRGARRTSSKEPGASFWQPVCPLRSGALHSRPARRDSFSVKNVERSSREKRPVPHRPGYEVQRRDRGLSRRVDGRYQCCHLRY